MSIVLANPEYYLWQTLADALQPSPEPAPPVGLPISDDTPADANGSAKGAVDVPLWRII